MMDAYVEFVDIDPFHWRYLGRYFSTRQASEKTVYVLVEGGRIDAIFDAVNKRPLDDSGLFDASVAARLLADCPSADQVVAIDHEKLRRYAREVSVVADHLDADEYFRFASAVLASNGFLSVFHRAGRRQTVDPFRFLDRLKALRVENLLACVCVFSATGKQLCSVVAKIESGKLTLVTTTEYFQAMGVARPAYDGLDRFVSDLSQLGSLPMEVLFLQEKEFFSLLGLSSAAPLVLPGRLPSERYHSSDGAILGKLAEGLTGDLQNP